MKIPVGDILRAVVKGGWFRKVLDAVRGVEVKVGGTTIALDEKPGAAPLRGSKFDRSPHQPGPPVVGRRR